MHGIVCQPVATEAAGWWLAYLLLQLLVEGGQLLDLCLCRQPTQRAGIQQRGHGEWHGHVMDTTTAAVFQPRRAASHSCPLQYHQRSQPKQPRPARSPMVARFSAAAPRRRLSSRAF